MIIAKFLRTPILKKICEQLLLMRYNKESKTISVKSGTIFNYNFKNSAVFSIVFVVVFVQLFQYQVMYRWSYVIMMKDIEVCIMDMSF